MIDRRIVPLPRGTTFALFPSMEILIVDDNRPILWMLEKLFRFNGFQVRLAVNGSDAVEIFRRYHQRIGLVLIDFHMPAPNGPATIAEIRKIDPRVPTLLMTGDQSGDAFLEGCETIAKPFGSLPALVEKVKDAMSNRAAPNE
jgi:DNA-binding NtrC family response regulator